MEYILNSNDHKIIALDMILKILLDLLIRKYHECL